MKITLTTDGGIIAGGIIILNPEGRAPDGQQGRCHKTFLFVIFAQLWNFKF
jgi:hypothetical protein